MRRLVCSNSLETEPVREHLKALPENFLERLKKDIAYKNKNKVLRAIKMTSEELNGVLKRELLLTRTKIIEIAKALNQPIEQYLVLADCISDPLKKILEPSGLLPIFRSEEMTPEEIDSMIAFIDKFITDIDTAKSITKLMSIKQTSDPITS